VNRFVDTLNRIRQRAGVEWLTPSQRRAYALLRERLEFLDAVNLWGAHGTGKTFIGWVLDRQGLAAYAARLEAFEPALAERVVVVDNSDWRRRAVRDALHRCREYGYGKVVLISTEPVQEQMASVELRLTADDLQAVAENLRTVGVAPYNDAPKNLWDMVSPLPLSH
jgi:hypothetical protein